MTVSELVENSPSITADGSAIKGSLSTTLYYIDSVSGRLLRSVSDVEHSGVDSAVEGEFDNVGSQFLSFRCSLG